MGKAFVELACKEPAYEGSSLYLLNRGSRPLPLKEPEKKALRGMKIAEEYRMDRHDTERIRQIAGENFDVVVDFCAYSEGDIRSVVDALGGAVGQYIFVSTCDVYRRGTKRATDESGALEERNFGGEAGAYIAGKAALEKELVSCCGENDIRYTSLRPAFIYGPDNYAPREGIFFNWIEQAGQIIYPEDADGEFQMVYVKDVAKLLLAACMNPKAYDKAYNVCGEGVLNYERFAEILRKATGMDFEKVNISVEEIQKRNIPLPFPLTRAETELYSGERVKELGVAYTPIERGMAQTYAWYKSSIVAQ